MVILRLSMHMVCVPFACIENMWRREGTAWQLLYNKLQNSQVCHEAVDRALHNRGRVNPEVAARIRKIADELGYRYHMEVPYPIRAHELKIGIIIPSIETATMQIVARGAHAAAEELRAFGVEVIIREQEQFNGEHQLACIDELMRAGVHGLAISPTSDPELCQRVDEWRNRESRW